MTPTGDLLFRGFCSPPFPDFGLFVFHPGVSGYPRNAALTKIKADQLPQLGFRDDMACGTWRFGGGGEPPRIPLLSLYFLKKDIVFFFFFYLLPHIMHLFVFVMNMYVCMFTYTIHSSMNRRHGDMFF